MGAYERLTALLDTAQEGKPWLIGKIPNHFKRLSCSKEEALRLAILGAKTIAGYFGDKCYFTQSVIAGAIISGDYDNITICTPSQFGKSWLMGRASIVQAYNGHTMFVTGATGDTTQIIMNHIIAAAQQVDPVVQKAMTAAGKSAIEKLATSLSKSRISFADHDGIKGGSLEALSLGEQYSGMTGNKAIGRAGDFIVDEAALVSDDTLSELGRREFARIDGGSYPLIMISNPHQPGTFWNNLVGEVGERDIVIWIDALTAVEEGRFTREKVLSSNWATHPRDCMRYLLCDLPEIGLSMFEEPDLVDEAPECDVYYLGVDAAYKGKDNISVCILGFKGEDIYVADIVILDKGEAWIDGVTSEDLIRDVATIYSAYGVLGGCIDSGQGIWLMEGLTKRGYRFKGINFNQQPTKERIKANHYAAVNAANVRAEMHLDLQELIESKRLKFTKKTYKMVKDTLPFVSSTRKANGKLIVRPKQEIKAMLGRSPDELDSVLLALHAAIIDTA